MSKANEMQVGGGHYAGDYQHWDFVKDVGLGYHAGNASKYIARYANKNGKQDLEKALHYIEKCKELGLKGVQPDDLSARYDRLEILGRFAVSARMNLRQYAAHQRLLDGAWGLAATQVQKLIDEHYPAPPKTQEKYPYPDVEEKAPDMSAEGPRGRWAESADAVSEY